MGKIEGDKRIRPAPDAVIGPDGKVMKPGVVKVDAAEPASDETLQALKNAVEALKNKSTKSKAKR